MVTDRPRIGSSESSSKALHESGGVVGLPTADICVVTPYPAHTEPRGPRHARAWAEAFPNRKVLFLDCAAEGAARPRPRSLQDLPNLRWHTHRFGTRQANFVQWLAAKARQRASLWYFRRGGVVTSGLLAPELHGLRKILAATRAAIYHAHKWEVFLPLLEAGARPGSCVFDCMEFYSEMGEGQGAEASAAIRKVEDHWLPQSGLLTTSSPEVSAAYSAICPMVETIALYNCPARVEIVNLSPGEPLRLYWRNTVVALGQRGLEDALDALMRLPEDVTLHAQGHLSRDGGVAVREAVERRGLSRRVTLVGPYEVDRAVEAASKFNIGLCLERDVNTNHRLTVSNKMFDYHMAGLAVVASDLPGLRRVIETSRGGLLYKPGDPASLAECIAQLREDRKLLQTLRANARSYALSMGNCESQMDLFAIKVRQLFGSTLA